MAEDKSALLASFATERLEMFKDFVFKPVENYRINKGTGSPEAVLEKRSANNMAFILEASPFKDHIRFDEFSQRVMITDDEGTHAYGEADYLAIKQYAETKHHFIEGEQVTRDGISLYARRVASYNAVEDYVEATQWDGKPRAMSMFSDLLGAANDEYTQLVTRMFWANLINRIYHPGSKVDEMVVLIGEQGIGKSSIFEQLMGSENNWYKSYNKLETDEKRASSELARLTIVEFGEMSAFKPSTIEELKEFLTRTTDIYTPSYGKHVVEQPRHNIFVGTTNRTTFIYDFSGGRRFLPLETGADKSLIKSHPLDAGDDYYHQVLAEARHLVLDEGMSARTTAKETAMLRSHQETILMSDDQSDELERFFNMEMVPLEWDSLDMYRQRQYFEGYPDTMENQLSSLLMPFDKVHSKTVYEVALQDHDYLNKPQTGMNTKITAIANKAGWSKKKSIKLLGKVSTGFKKDN